MLPQDTSFYFDEFGLKNPGRVRIFLSDVKQRLELRKVPILFCRLEVEGRVSTIALRGGEKPVAWVRLDWRPEKRWRRCTPPVDKLLMPIRVMKEHLEDLRDGHFKEFQAMVEGMNAKGFDDPELGDTHIPADDEDHLWSMTNLAMRKWAKANSIDLSTLEGRERAAIMKQFLSLTQQTMESQAEPHWAHWSHPYLKVFNHSYQSLSLVEPWLASFDADGLAFLDENGFREGRWQIMNLWMCLPEFRVSMVEHPALAWLFACAWHAWNFPKSGDAPHDSLCLMEKSRHSLTMLEWLGISARHETLFLLNLWSCKDLKVRHWPKLLDALRSPLVGVLLRGRI